MASLPTIKRFLMEDYPSEASWIGGLLYPLNLLLDTIYSNLNNGLSVGQNMLAQINTLPISGLSPTTTFLWKFSTPPVGVLLINTVQVTAPTTPIAGTVSAQFTYNAGIITVAVVGLPTSGTYNITFYSVGG